MDKEQFYWVIREEVVTSRVLSKAKDAESAATSVRNGNCYLDEATTELSREFQKIVSVDVAEGEVR